jgi:hypothetical protein
MNNSKLGMPEHVWKSILDTLIPATSNNHGASEIIMIEELITDISHISDMKQFKLFLEDIPENFSIIDQSARENILETLGKAFPESLDALLNATYTIYYSHPSVLSKISENTGYSTTAPQPNGYVLKPFDERLLRKSKERPAMWRIPE